MTAPLPVAVFCDCAGWMANEAPSASVAMNIERDSMRSLLPFCRTNGKGWVACRRFSEASRCPVRGGGPVGDTRVCTKLQSRFRQRERVRGATRWNIRKWRRSLRLASPYPTLGAESTEKTFRTGDGPAMQGCRRLTASSCGLIAVARTTYAAVPECARLSPVSTTLGDQACLRAQLR